MERYENLGLVGEGSYGMVMKCRHKETNQIVAIKKFIESEDDKMVKKIAMREIRMLKQLHHENLVNLLEVFRRKKRLFLVFEFVDRTVLDDLEKRPSGLDDISAKRITYQVLRGLEFCHNHNIIHRDVKPENILVSKSGIVKLCDFGFARTLAIGPGEVFTDYVATRWYRAPELLVGDTHYGKAVDIWAVGCLLAEMLTGEPLFPGDSDIDQLHHITKTLGDLTQRHKEIFQKNPLFLGMRLPDVSVVTPLEKRYPKISQHAMDVIKQSLILEASERPSCAHMMQHVYFTKDNFAEKLLSELRLKIEKETAENPLLRAIVARRDNLEEKTRREREKERERKLRKESRDSTHRLAESKKRKDHATRKQSSSSLQQLEKTSSTQDTRVSAGVHDVNTCRSSRKMGGRNSQLSPRQELKTENGHEEYNNSTNHGSPNWSDVKISSRTTLPLNVSSPAADLPELTSQQGYRGHEPKTKKIGNPGMKKNAPTIDANTPTVFVGERIQGYDQRGNNENRHNEILGNERLPRKKGGKDKEGLPLKRDGSDIEFPHLSTGLTLPFVKGVEAKSVSKQLTSKPYTKKSYFSTMPHISTTDFYQNGPSGVDKEYTFERGSKDREREGKDQNNLPAV